MSTARSNVSKRSNVQEYQLTGGNNNRRKSTQIGAKFVQADGCPSKQYDRVVSYWFRRGDEQFDKLVEASQRLPAGNIRSAAQVGVFPSPDQKENFESRIEGGEKGFIQQFPWIASLHVRKAHQCTGSLFSNQWILTAGHCRKASKTPSDWEAFLGIADQDEAPALRNGASSNGHFSIISGIVYHPDWERVLYRADIALMKMKVPIPEYSEYIMPICLPNTETTARLVSESHFKLAGFSADQAGLSSILVSPISSDQCQSDFKDKFNVLTDHMCTARDDSTCVGDHGAPLFKPIFPEGEDYGLYFHVATSSFGLDCNADATIYSRTPTYSKWIQSAMHHFDTFIDT